MPFVKVGQFLYVSGQISQDENGLITGKLGENMNVEQGKCCKTMRTIITCTG